MTKRDITLGEIVEGMARKINPEAWRVMDGYLAETGQNAAWPADQFKHKESLAVASATLTALLTTANITEAQLIALAMGEAVVVPKDIRTAFYFPIEMPVTAEGNGPASIGKDAVKMTYEVWDQELTTHGSHDYLPDAINQANTMNAALKARP